MAFDGWRSGTMGKRGHSGMGFSIGLDGVIILNNSMVGGIPPATLASLHLPRANAAAPTSQVPTLCTTVFLTCSIGRRNLSHAFSRERKDPACCQHLFAEVSLVDVSRRRQAGSIPISLFSTRPRVGLQARCLSSHAVAQGNTRALMSH